MIARDDLPSMFAKEANQLRVLTEDRLLALDQLEAQLAAGASGDYRKLCTELLEFARASLTGTDQLIRATLTLANTMKEQRAILDLLGVP